MSNTRQSGEEKRPQGDHAAEIDLDPGAAAKSVRGGKQAEERGKVSGQAEERMK